MANEEVLIKARLRILSWLSYRSRSRHEAERYLAGKGFPDAIVKVVIDEMQDYRYLDDERFTEEYIQLCLRRGFGPYRVRQGLSNKGIERDLIDTGIARHFDSNRDLARAVALIEKRVEHDQALHDHKWLRRQVLFLKGRGFREAVAIKALGRFYRGPLDSEDETLS